MLSAATFIEGMVDVLVVVIALDLVGLGDAGVGWLNAAWGIGGLAGGAVALKLLARERLGLALPARRAPDRRAAARARRAPAHVDRARRADVLGVGYALTESAGITLLQRLAHDRVRARAFGVVESSYWLTTGAGAMLAPALVALTSPRARARDRRRRAAGRSSSPAAARSGDWRRPPLAHVRQRRQQRLDLSAQVLEVRRQRQPLSQRLSRLVGT